MRLHGTRMIPFFQNKDHFQNGKYRNSSTETSRLAKYKKIQLEALKEDPQAFGSSYKEWVNFSDEKWQERPSNKDSMIFVAKDEASPIGFDALKTHIGIYPYSGEVIEMFKDKLHAYGLSKGAIRVDPDKPIEENLLKEIILYRIKQIESKNSVCRKFS